VTDLGILATNWQGLGKSFSQGDFNYDGRVDVTDLGILATSWQKSLPPPAAAALRNTSLFGDIATHKVESLAQSEGLLE